MQRAAPLPFSAGRSEAAAFRSAERHLEETLFRADSQLHRPAGQTAAEAPDGVPFGQRAALTPCHPALCSGALHGQPDAAEELRDALEGNGRRARRSHPVAGHALIRDFAQTPPQIRPFAQEEFVSALERDGPGPTSAPRGDWTGLYGYGRRVAARPAASGFGSRAVRSVRRKFFKSPNFDGWYRRRLREMTGQLESLHLEVICQAVRRWRRNRTLHAAPPSLALTTVWHVSQDLLGWTRDKSEVEIVDLVVKLREKLVSPAHQNASTASLFRLGGARQPHGPHMSPASKLHDAVARACPPYSEAPSGTAAGSATCSAFGQWQACRRTSREETFQFIRRWQSRRSSTGNVPPLPPPFL